MCSYLVAPSRIESLLLLMDFCFLCFFLIMQVAERLIVMHEECLDGNFSSIEKLRQSPLPQVARSHVSQVT